MTQISIQLALRINYRFAYRSPISYWSNNISSRIFSKTINCKFQENNQNSAESYHNTYTLERLRYGAVHDYSCTRKGKLFQVKNEQIFHCLRIKIR